MTNRVMAAKARKLRMQKRSRPRELSLDVRGPRPDMQALQEYKIRARSLGVDESTIWPGFKNVPPGKVDIRNRSEEILNRFDQPLFVEHVCNHVQRIRIYFNSRQTECIIQQMHFHQRVARISKTYTSIDDVYFVLKEDIVSWAHEKPFTNR